MNDDSKAKLSFAEEISRRLAVEGFLSSDAPEDVSVTAEVIHEMIQPILHTVESIRTILSPYQGRTPWTTTSAECDHESCERLAAVQKLLFPNLIVCSCGCDQNETGLFGKHKE